MQPERNLFRDIVSRLVERLNRRYNIYLHHWKKLVMSPARMKVFAQWLRDGCPLNGIGPVTLEDRVTIYSQMLDENFITPLQIERLWGVKYSKKQRKNLVNTLPSITTISRLAEIGCILFPLAPEKMSCADISVLNEMNDREGFDCDTTNESCWSKSKTGQACWVAINPAGFDTMLGQKWDRQIRTMKKHGCHAVNMPELLFIIVTCRLLYAVNIIPNMRIRVEELSEFGSRLCLESIGENGFPRVNACSEDLQNRDIGAAMKFIFTPTKRRP